MSENPNSQPISWQLQNAIVRNNEFVLPALIKQYWDALSSLTDRQQLILVAIIMFSLAIDSTIDETLEMLDPDCARVSEPFEELLEAIATEPPTQQLILIQAITTAVGTSMFTADI